MVLRILIVGYIEKNLLNWKTFTGRAVLCLIVLEIAKRACNHDEDERFYEYAIEVLAILENSSELKKFLIHLLLSCPHALAKHKDKWQFVDNLSTNCRLIVD